MLESVIKWIEKNLKLPVNRSKSGNSTTGNGSLLGFKIHPDGGIDISDKSLKKLKTKVRELWDGRQSLTSSELRDNWLRYINGWWSYFNITTKSWNLDGISNWTRRHIRKCFWQRWSTPRGRIKNLKRLGVKPRSLGIGYTGLGAWRIAKRWCMHQALDNKTLYKYGFRTPWETVAIK